MSELIHIEVAYARPDKQAVIPLSVESGTSIEQAILQSGILQQFPEINLADHHVGVFSQPRRLDDLVKKGDRIEIYRLLEQDPKELRRKRAKE